MTEQDRQEFREWMAAGMPQETLDKWTELVRRLTEDDDETV